jgi:hypothetical protein
MYLLSFQTSFLRRAILLVKELALLPVWVTNCRHDYVCSMTGVPHIAAEVAR